MKVKITGHSELSKFTQWWYADRVGETFEVVEDEERPQYYLTNIKIRNSEYRHHIKKVDCEVIE